MPPVMFYKMVLLSAFKRRESSKIKLFFKYKYVVCVVEVFLFHANVKVYLEYIHTHT